MPRGRSFFVVAAALLAMLAVTSHAALLASERPAVQAMLDAWAPAGWDTDVAAACGPPSWPGLTCDYADTSVTQILLGHNHLDGTIPTNFNLLTNLEVLDLQDTNTSGPIPANLFTLPKLANVYLNDNELSGDIPSVTALTAIVDLYLHNNSLSGEIPVGLGSLSKLSKFSVHHNNMTGPIPTDLGTSTSLTEFHAGYNGLTGGIPDNIGNLVGLTFLDLGMNEALGGTIPTTFENLVNLKLLYLQHCALTGNIPVGLANMTQLELIWLFDNGLTLCPAPAWTQTFNDGTCEAGHQSVASCSSGCGQTWEAAGCHTPVDPACAPFAATPVMVPAAPVAESPDAPIMESPDAPMAPMATPVDSTPVTEPSSGFQVVPALLFTLAVASISVLYL